MRKAQVFYKGRMAGQLVQRDDESFVFSYDEDWLQDRQAPAISLTLPRRQPEHHSPTLFPFFFHLLPEGANKEVVCHALRIDPEDHFGLLLATARHDVVGAITLHPYPPSRDVA